MGVALTANRWHHHDWLARTCDPSSSCARFVRSDGRSQEPPVPDDLALDFSATALKHGARCVAGRGTDPAPVKLHLRAASTSEKGQALSPRRQPVILVPDHPGSDSGRCNNRGSNHRGGRGWPRSGPLVTLMTTAISNLVPTLPRGNALPAAPRHSVIQSGKWLFARLRGSPSIQTDSEVRNVAFKMIRREEI
jgi:hypothetical protein